MIAMIRIRDGTSSSALCKLDLMRFTEEQVRERMSERGIRGDAFFVCGFVDWEVDRVMTLQEAYALKKCILCLYDGDDYVVQELLKRHKPFGEIISSCYEFCSKDELETVKKLFSDIDSSELIKYFCKVGSWNNLIANYINAGYLLQTNKGFYINQFR
ncbi:hypothetical protein [Streptococcus mutans]|uniref:hypothetical protein n=1 Tax=Streptococcus mutans TaxID=1309 RepID=UPI0002B57741|nr:hypothetical protein [Streptococcus mutans]EMC33405.1 hypothetical protein SMU89_03928 [Streptococcus mutans NLML1]